MTGARLEVRGLTKAYYGVRALDDVDFTVEPGELVGLIGPNGSGKTTALDCISGVQRQDAGEVRFEGRAISRRPPHRLTAHGLVRTFQATRVFGTLSVRENLRVAAVGRLRGAARVARLLGWNRDWGALDRRIDELVAGLNLAHVAHMPAGELSYGQRKLVEFATACVVPPRLLLLDEPVAAVNPTIANVMRDWIVQLHEDGTSILLVEHNIELVVGVCERVVVLDHGVKIADGPPRDVVGEDAVQEAYFGR